MLAVVAEMECELLIEHTRVGLSRAKSEGKKFGRLYKIAPEARRAIIEKKNNHSGLPVEKVSKKELGSILFLIFSDCCITTG